MSSRGESSSRRKRSQDGTSKDVSTGHEATTVGSPTAGKLLLKLPEEVLAQILSYLPDINSILNGPARVCRRLNQASKHPAVWKHITIRFRPGIAVIPRPATVTYLMDNSGETNPVSCGNYFSGMKLRVNALKELTVKGSSISSVTLFDLPTSLTHLHLDCDVPNFFFEPLKDPVTRGRCPAISCLRIQLRPDQQSTVLELANFSPRLTSLAVTCSANTLPNLVTLFGQIGRDLDHLCVNLSGSTTDTAEKVADMVFASCCKLATLCVKFDNGTINFRFIWILTQLTSTEAVAGTIRNSLTHLSLGAKVVEADSSGENLKLFFNLETLDIWTDNVSNGNFGSRCRFLLPNTKLRMHNGKSIPFAVYPEMIKHL